MINADELNFDKLNGLLPAVIVDNITNQVLMVGFMNREALEKTLEIKKVTYFSRSRNVLWTKGETSGNYLHLIDIEKDCDADSILVYARPSGPVCHTGNYSCFGTKKNNFNFLNYLSELIRERKNTLPEKSYTTKLFMEGSDRIIQKVGEEAVETVIAAKNRDKKEVINETSDLLFHLLVMLADQEIEVEEIIDNLMKRHKPDN